MSSTTNWLPGTRQGQLNMARVWLEKITSIGAAWGIPAALVTEFSGTIAYAAGILEQAMSSDRTSFITAECKAAFERLVEKMRYIKDRYFKSPPLLDPEFIALLLKPRDPTSTSRGTPRAMMTAEIIRSGPAMLLLKLVYADGTESLADPHTDIEYQIRQVKYNPANPVLNLAGGEIDHVPTDPLELPVVFTTRRKRETVTFHESDSGKIAYFAIRISNGKTGGGGSNNEGYGPWCHIFSAVIP